MKRILKFLAFTVALPVTLVVILIMLLQGCRKPMVCDPVHPATGPAGTGPATGTSTAPASQSTTITDTRSIFSQTRADDRPPICDPVHIPPPPGDPVNLPPGDPVHVPPPPTPPDTQK